MVVISRHSIAHSGSQNILNDINEIKIKYSKFFLAYVQSYQEILKEELLLCCVKNNYKYLLQCNPRETYFASRKTLTFDCQVKKIKLNDLVIIEKENGSFDYNTVINLMTNDKIVAEASVNDPIGIKFLREVKKNDKLYFINE